MKILSALLLALSLLMLPGLPLRAAIPVPESLEQPLDFSKIPNTWRFKPGDNMDYRLPEWDDSAWDIIKSLPHNWRHPSYTPYSPENFAWYRVRFQFPEKEHPHSLLLKLGPIKDADEVYFNGTLIGKSGKIDRGGEIPKKHAYDKIRLYPVPPGSIRYNEENVLAIRVQALFSDSAGFDTSISHALLGNEKKILNAAYLWNMIPFLFSVVIITVGSYFLFMFIRRRETYENLLFAGLCYSISGYFILGSQVKYYLGLDFYRSKKIEYILVSIMLYIFTDFFYFYFPERTITLKNRVRKYLVYCANCIPLTIAAIVIATGDIRVWNNVNKLALQPLLIVPFSLSFWILIENSLRKNRDALLMLAGISQGIVTIINDILVKRNLLPWGSVGHFGFFIFLLFFAAILANRYMRLQDEIEELNINLEEKVRDRTEQLEETMEEMSEINKLLKTAHEMADIDMLMAVHIQSALFPGEPPQSSEWDIAFTFTPMAGVSGDFYDFYEDGDQLLGVSLFDVSGHGISSGLITMIARSIIFNQFHENHSEELNDLIRKANIRLKREIGKIDNYLTGVLLRFTGPQVEYVNAGHPDILHKKAGTGKIETPGKNQEGFRGGLLGLEKFKVSFGVNRFSMAQGDMVLLHSDGLTDSTNPHKESYKKKIIPAFSNAPTHTAAGAMEHILNDYYSFLDTNLPQDDLTIMVIKRLS
ncbi:MAG: SpoIIE family protein phosphatase [bacterium]|nr:SpoIIE family protein phosphatase [bacterium]